MRSFPKPHSFEPAPNGVEPAYVATALRGYLLRRKPGAAGTPASKASRQSQQTRRAHRQLLCAQCRAPITRENARCHINGDSEHRCLNPAGIYYHILCFREAAGCRVDGIPTEEYSWFPGYCWQLACCGRCCAHLGWFFSAASPVFFGLIRNSLVADKE